MEFTDTEILGGAGAQALALLTELAAPVSEYNSHIHQGFDTSPTSGPIAAGSIIINPFPPPSHLIGVPTSGAAPTGTTILKGK